MRKLYLSALALAAMMLVGSPAFAQRGGFGGFGGSAMLLRQESVQKELKMTDEQKTKATEYLTELFQGAQERFQGFRDLSQEERQAKVKEFQKESDAAVAKILKPEQVKRLKQISYQQARGFALAQDEVAAAVKLTKEQKDKVATMQREFGEQAQQIFQNAAGDREAARAEMEKFRKEVDGKILGTLTEEQKKALKELVGEEFKGEIVPFRRQQN